MAERMDEAELRAITDQEMRAAVGFWSGRMGQQRTKALAYYYGEAKFDLTPPEIEGRSTVVSPDVRNTVESMLPQLAVKFYGSDRVVEFEATKPGDEKKAEQATDYVNHQFYVKNPGERIAYNWMKDALLSKNGIVKVWWDNSAVETREEYVGLTDVELAQIMDDSEVEIIEQKSYPDEEDAEQRQKALEQLIPQAKANPQAAQQVAQIQAMPPKMLFDVVCKRTKEGGRVRIENVPPEEFLISRKAKSIEDASFVAHRVARSLSDLRQNYPKANLDDISGDDQSANFNMERIERLAYDDEMAYLNADQITSSDESQRMVWVTECYIKCDYDGDGISELRKVVRAGNQILENEIVDCAPFVSICPVPMPHKFFGLSVADLAMEGQKINTNILRATLDNLYLEVNGRYFAVDGQVNLDDLLASRPGGVVRVKQQGAVGKLEQGMGNSPLAMNMMEFMKGFQEDSTGWTRYNQGSDGDSLNHTATGVNQITNRADMRLDLIARNFAEGFRELFKLILKLCAQYTQREEIIKLRGEWVPVNPREWRNGFDVTINVGLGTGNKDQIVNHLMALGAQQQFGLQIGTVTPENVYQMQAELVKALGFKSADKFFSDPAKQPPKPPPPNPEIVKAQAQMQLEQFKAQAKAQQESAMKEAELAFERERMSLQAQVDTNRQRVEAEQKALEAAAARELEQMKIQAQIELERAKAQIQQETAVLIAKINAEAKIMATEVQAKTVATEAQDNAADNAVNDADDQIS